jgi:hypothetical protein
MYVCLCLPAQRALSLPAQNTARILRVNIFLSHVAVYLMHLSVTQSCFSGPRSHCYSQSAVLKCSITFFATNAMSQACVSRTQHFPSAAMHELFGCGFSYALYCVPWRQRQNI